MYTAHRGLIGAHERLADEEGYLAMNRGREALAEFQKILDHRGVVLNVPIGALAMLQQGRAYAMQGDTAKAQVAYLNFLNCGRTPTRSRAILKLTAESDAGQKSASDRLHRFVGNDRRAYVYGSDVESVLFVG